MKDNDKDILHTWKEISQLITSRQYHRLAFLRPKRLTLSQKISSMSLK